MKNFYQFIIYDANNTNTYKEFGEIGLKYAKENIRSYFYLTRYECLNSLNHFLTELKLRHNKNP